MNLNRRSMIASGLATLGLARFASAKVIKPTIRHDLVNWFYDKGKRMTEDCFRKQMESLGYFNINAWNRDYLSGPFDDSRMLHKEERSGYYIWWNGNELAKCGIFTNIVDDPLSSLGKRHRDIAIAWSLPVVLTPEEYKEVDRKFSLLIGG